MSDEIEIHLRSLVIECLRKKREFGAPLTVDLICDEIGRIAKDRRLKINQENSWHEFNGTITLHANLPPKIWDIVWDLIVEGVIRPGTGGVSGNSNLPSIHLTAFGFQALQYPDNPYDPDGYLKSINEKIPDVDDIILRYIAESAETLRKNCLLSSSVTLGCASEKALLLLMDAYKDSLNQTDQATFIKENEKKHSIKRRHEDFIQRYQNSLRKLLIGHMNSDRLTVLDNALNFVFNHFRDARNEAGHPTGTIPIRQEVHANLVLFPKYLEVIYELKNWLLNNKRP